ncbi:hypothetical protein TSAR_004502 [Trichomalopsis sarcophagae]|uniref:Uncharacterized protein n=1 Tax=Trichomalopsis sarcophagae TaxID=543379 RepID=A0A232EY92_9HYME|nr:hypothetical protein TSAR_004502 [Trichomalopsis sarcophagae]
MVSRARAGHNQNPTAMQLRHNLQYTIAANIRSASKSTNCELDGTIDLTLLIALKLITLQQLLMSRITFLLIAWDYNLFGSAERRLHDRQKVSSSSESGECTQRSHRLGLGGKEKIGGKLVSLMRPEGKG